MLPFKTSAGVVVGFAFNGNASNLNPEARWAVSVSSSTITCWDIFTRSWCCAMNLQNGISLLTAGRRSSWCVQPERAVLKHVAVYRGHVHAGSRHCRLCSGEGRWRGRDQRQRGQDLLFAGCGLVNQFELRRRREPRWGKQHRIWAAGLRCSTIFISATRAAPPSTRSSAIASSIRCSRTLTLRPEHDGADGRRGWPLTRRSTSSRPTATPATCRPISRRRRSCSRSGPSRPT